MLGLISCGWRQLVFIFDQGCGQVSIVRGISMKSLSSLICKGIVYSYGFF